MKKLAALILIAGIVVSPASMLYADRSSIISGTASALIPGLGQILNNEHAAWKGRIKIAAMLGIELGAILATPSLAEAGFPKVMIGVAMFAANHLWSATDAYHNALKRPEIYLSGPAMR